MAKKRNYKSEYKNYQGSEEQKHNRALRNKARRAAIRKGTAKKGDGTDVHHVKPLAKGGSGALSNTKVVKKGNNRSFRRTKSAKMK